MKRVKVILSVLLIGLFLATCSDDILRNQAIAEVNRNSDVPFALALPASKLKNTDEYFRSEGWGCYSLGNDDIFFTISGYPDCLDKYHVTEYQIKSSKYTFMGLQVGCSLDMADEVMERNGYKISTQNNWLSRYTKSGVRVGVDLSDDIVTAFRVSVEVTNKKNVVF